jgi:hypothetical protein
MSHNSVLHTQSKNMFSQKWRKHILASAFFSVLSVGGVLVAAQNTVFAQSAAVQTAAPQAEAAKDTGGYGRSMRGEGRSMLSSDELSALSDARITGIKTGLKLSADQEKLWSPVEQTLRQMSTERIAAREQWQNQRKARMEARSTDGKSEKPAEPAPRMDFTARLDQQAERAAMRATNMKKLADAVKPLWASLDDKQKRLLPLLMRDQGGRGNRG